MTVADPTILVRLEEEQHRGYYLDTPGPNYWYQDRPASETDFEALTQPLDIAASNGINRTLASVQQARYPSYIPWTAFSIGNGSCANSSEEYLDRQREQGTCFNTCHERSTLFLPFNLETCVKLATIGVLIGNGTLQMDQSVDTNTTVETFGIGSMTAWDGVKVLNDVVQCVVSSCGDNSIGTCPPSVRGLGNVTVNSESLPDIAKGLAHFCDGVDAKLNPDIAGPGVMLSYLLQSSITLFLFLILKTLNSWVRMASWPLIILVGKIFKPRGPSAWARATMLQNRLALTRLNAATITSLVEFQEVQAFFLIAIQIATLATSRIEGRSSSGSNSFAEVLLNAQMVQSLAVNSVLPVVLTQCILQREGMLWWYSFGLTSTTVLLAQIVRAPSMSRASNFEALWQNFKEASPVEACGGLPNPMTYCNMNNYNSNHEDWRGTGVALAFVYITIASLLIDMVAAVPSVQNIIKLNLSRASLAADRHELRGFLFLVLRHYLWPCFREFWWFGVQTGLLAFVISYFTEVLVMGFSVDLMHFANFNYGQLISVMVWAPTLGKFAYFSTFGIEEGFGRRLAKNYRVVRDVYECKSHKRRHGIYHWDGDGYGCNFDDKKKSSRSGVSVSTMSTEELETPGHTMPNLSGPRACYRKTTSLPRQPMSTASRSLNRLRRLSTATSNTPLPRHHQRLLLSSSAATLKMKESEIKRNPHPDFKQVEASRPPWDRDSEGFKYTQVASPSWKFGSGANDLATEEQRRRQHVTIDPFAEGRAPVNNYKLLISAVVPRPIAFVSTVSHDGKTTNLAPFSYFQVINHDPPLFVIGFASSLEGAAAAKHTLHNLAETRECTVNIISEHFAEAANSTSINAPYGASEWAVSGLTPAYDCHTVKPARVKEAVFSIEAKLESLREFESRSRPGTKNATMVILEGTRFWVREDAINEDRNIIDPAVLRPVSRLGGITYGRTIEGFEIPRPDFTKDLGGPEGYEKLEGDKGGKDGHADGKI